MKKRIVILGSTGSIGAQTLDVVREFRDEFEVVGLAAGHNADLLADQIAEFQPQYFDCLAHDESVMSGATRLSATDMVRLDDVDFVMHAMSGTTGLEASQAALVSGKTVGLANKESIVMAGQLLRHAASVSGGRMVPVDSEPSAIWQCIVGEESEPVKYYITASGGSFRDRDWSDLDQVTPQEALEHPNWVMGPKITVDCATMMNKAFEVVETSVMFDAEFDDIEVVLHRESIVHAMVKFADGSLKAQIGPPDMRQPIQFALFHPERRMRPKHSDFDLTKLGRLTFAPMLAGRYPCYDIAMHYARLGGTYPTALAGADDGAVQLFLDGKIGFTDIRTLIERVMERHQPEDEFSIGRANEIASWAARKAASIANE